MGSETARRIVIIGAGQAGAQAALELRQAGFDGAVTLVGEEPYPPYQRPPLSKAFLAGEMERERLFFRPEELYAKQDIRLLQGARAVAVACDESKVRLQDGTALDYDRLLLATGTRERRARLPGAEQEGVFYLRGLDHSLALGRVLRPGTRLVIMGGGYIGLEIAAVARKKGLEVAVLEAEERVLARVTAAPVSAFVTRAHRAAGVDVRTGAKVARLLGEGKVCGVECEDGTRLEADAVVIGIGAVPAVELAEAAGLAVDNGIVVDECGRATREGRWSGEIFAAGDCTNHPNALLGGRLRLESVQNALDQGRAVARVMAGGEEPYDAVAWFWSDQYDIKLRIAGISRGYDQTVLRGTPEAGAFSLFYLREGVVIAADTVNEAKDFMAAKQLIAKKARVAAEALADKERKLMARTQRSACHDG